MLKPTKVKSSLIMNDKNSRSNDWILRKFLKIKQIMNKRKKLVKKHTKKLRIKENKIVKYTKYKEHTLKLQTKFNH